LSRLEEFDLERSLSALSALSAALEKVDLTADEVVAAGGSVLDVGMPFLVGSLAQGFGNRGSDVDIHLFVADLERATPPFLIFIGDVPVDVEHFPATLPGTLVDALGERTADTGLGPLALGTVLERHARKRLTRWLTALPMRGGIQPIFSPTQRARVYPHLLRFALSRLLTLAAMAEVCDRAGYRSDYHWRLCGRATLDVLCTAAGYPPIGDKWLPSRVRRADLSMELVTTAAEVRSLADVRAILLRYGGLAIDPLSVTLVQRAPGVRDVRLGRQTYLHTCFGRLEQPGDVPLGQCGDVLARHDARAVVDLLRTGVIRLMLDDEGLDRSVAA